MEPPVCGAFRSGHIEAELHHQTKQRLRDVALRYQLCDHRNLLLGQGRKLRYGCRSLIGSTPVLGSTEDEQSMCAANPNKGNDFEAIVAPPIYALTAYCNGGENQDCTCTDPPGTPNAGKHNSHNAAVMKLIVLPPPPPTPSPPTGVLLPPHLLGQLPRLWLASAKSCARPLVTFLGIMRAGARHP